MRKLSLLAIAALLLAGCGSNSQKATIKGVSRVTVPNSPLAPSMASDEPDEASDSSGQNGTDPDGTDSSEPWNMKKDYPLELDIINHVTDICYGDQNGGWNEQKLLAADKYVMNALNMSTADKPKLLLPQLERISDLLDEYYGVDGNGSEYPNLLMRLTWQSYLGHKYLKAVKDKCPQIEWDKEKSLLDTLAERLKSCIYNGGSQYTMNRASITTDAFRCFNNVMRCCLHEVSDSCKTMIQDAAFEKLFDEAEHIVFVFEYPVTDEDGSYTQRICTEERPDLINGLATAFWQWRYHRARSYMKIKDSRPSLASAYCSAARPYEKKLFISVKNHFQDLTVSSSALWDVMLHFDCTDEEMYSYSYEKAMQEYFRQ